jgi:FtsP/CotA-like multicopper oxidase with cupredoxin domain
MDEFAQGRTRRDFLKAAGLGALGTMAGGGLMARGPVSRLLVPNARAATTSIALAATDGYITLPGREDNPIYIFGFVAADPNDSVATLTGKFKGHAQHTAPVLGFDQNDQIKVTLTNLGLVQRPDLTDSHTIHWHGFDIPSPLFDGVPEVSIAVPIGKQVTYFYRPHREGTYMYHCHFEDVEHVQMGMTSIVYVRPAQDKTGAGPGVPISRLQPGGSPSGPMGYAYNDRDGSTAYDRHFAILLNEIWSLQHDGDRDIQETTPTNYDPDWFTMNGRSYPQTALPNDDPPNAPGWLPESHTSSGLTTVNSTTGTTDTSQPNSALMQVNPGDRVLLRLANLGYTQDAMELPGIPLRVVGQDASLLRNGTGPGAVDTSYGTNTIYMGPGEGRDVLFTAPGYDAGRPSGSDSKGNYNVYYFKNRDWRKLANPSKPGGPAVPQGGMMTEVRVYQNAPLDPQAIVNQTYA